MTPLLASIGAAALYGLIAWLLGAIIASYISERKGYGDKVGLATGFIFLAASLVVAVIWLVVPAKDGSAWKVDGPFGRRARPS
jgi:hypothetical protein